eukprot:CAMPEP_0179024808 /NCGR_PEP_ID=MMETSP0796-20121207/7646_1 /TAXON_ID=73915 /ORGANISM="Pyrodinium bahamense, Strain pbaha01" /LENGTH=221 /DNA_ID=CAMNT_0020720781 /DNA_START=127 /DNA_END=793 /DNA_ORIENTATION=-
MAWPQCTLRTFPEPSTHQHTRARSDQELGPLTHQHTRADGCRPTAAPFRGDDMWSDLNILRAEVVKVPLTRGVAAVDCGHMATLVEAGSGTPSMGLVAAIHGGAPADAGPAAGPKAAGAAGAGAPRVVQGVPEGTRGCQHEGLLTVSQQQLPGPGEPAVAAGARAPLAPLCPIEPRPVMVQGCLHSPPSSSSPFRSVLPLLPARQQVFHGHEGLLVVELHR